MKPGHTAKAAPMCKAHGSPKAGSAHNADLGTRKPHYGGEKEADELIANQLSKNLSASGGGLTSAEKSIMENVPGYATRQTDPRTATMGKVRKSMEERGIPYRKFKIGGK